MEDLLIEENIDLMDDIQIIEEADENGQKSYSFRGILSESDTLNRNRRVYPKAVLKEAFDAVKKDMDNGNLLVGEIDHPNGAKINLERIAVTFPILEWHETPEGHGMIYGSAKATKTQAGQLVEGLAKSGLKICFSTRCSGKVKPKKNALNEEYMEVQPGLKLIAIDVVKNPSCQKAVSETIYEDVENNASKDITVKETVTGRELIASLF